MNVSIPVCICQALPPVLLLIETGRDCFSYPGLFSLFIWIWKLLNQDQHFCWNLDENLIDSVDCYWKDGHFLYVNPNDPWPWEIFLCFDIILNFVIQRLEVLVVQVLVRVTPRYFMSFEAIVKGIVSLTLFSACLFSV